MKIGIIGLGIVGSAIKTAFGQVGHLIFSYDKKDTTTSIHGLMDTDCIFVCVPTDTVNQKCDVSQVIDVVAKISKNSYKGLVIIKSTVEPGTTQSLIDLYPLLRVCFVPEFLRQDHAVDDLTQDHQTLIVGTWSQEDFQFVTKLHSTYSEYAKMITPTEAELTKYFVNVYNCLRIVFANNFYKVCNHFGADYNKVLASAVTRPAVGHDHYLACDKDMQGYSGKCLPKDIAAFQSVLTQIDPNIELFKSIMKDNEKYL